MKMHQTSLLLLNLAMALAGAFTADAAPVSTHFSFQGQLKLRGVPVNGPHDITVTICAAPMDPPDSRIGIQHFNCEPVNNGLVNLEITLTGPGLFDCEGRWLEFAVRPCNSTLPYEVLTPRVEVLPTPFALSSLRACAVGSDGVTTLSIQNNAVTASKIASGEVVKSLNGLHDAVNLVAGANVTLTPSGNNLEISAAGPGGSGIWSLNAPHTYYNAGHVGIGTANPSAKLEVVGPSIRMVGPGGNGTQLALELATYNPGGDGPAARIQATDRNWSADLDFLTKQPGASGNPLVSRLHIDSSTGNVGIGTSSPANKLHIDLNSDTFTGLGIDDSYGILRLGERDNYYLRARYKTPFGLRDYFTHFIVTGEGRVGISTDSPKAALHVDGDYYGRGNLSLHAYEGDGSSGTAYVQARDTSGSNVDLQFRAQRLGTLFDTMRLVGPNVGIGTATPRSKLAVASGGPELLGSALSSTFVASAGMMPPLFGDDITLASFGTFVEGNNVSLGLHARRTVLETTGWTSTAIGLTFDVDNTIQAGAGVWLGANGNVGIGTTAPLRPLHVEGNEIHSGGSSAGFSFSDRTSAGLVEIPNAGERWVWYAQNGTANLWSGNNKLSIQPNGSFLLNGALHLRSARTYVEGFDGSDFHWWGQGPGEDNLAFGIKKIGTGNYEFWTSGRIVTPVLTITGGADLAEPFQMSHADIPEGSVVIIDEENPGKLKMSERAYDNRVAGIVSGANGIKAGITLHQEGLIEGGQNVALSGRVYVQADATEDAIKPGDLLTTSDTPGYAMKVTEHARAQGAILGKAMTGLKEGKGMVLVLVTLQ